MPDKKIKRGLGSGLSAIFGEETQAEISRTLPIARIEPRSDQPRTLFDEDAILELSESIRQHGLLQPITVRKLPDGMYQIIAGERRWRACRMAGLDQVPVNIVEADDKKAMELALVENLQRENLNPMEEARGYSSLSTEYGMTQEQIAESVGRSRPAVANALRLLTLDPGTTELVENGSLSAGHARALLRLEDPDKRAEAAALVISRNYNVRQTETLAAKLSAEPKKEPRPLSPDGINYTREAEKALETLLGRKVKICPGRKGGRVELEYYSADDREKLLSQLQLLGSLK